MIHPPIPAVNSFIPPTPQQGVYGGIQNYGVQQYLPIMEKRDLGNLDDEAVQEHLHHWLPRIRAGYSTPLPELLASPGKSAIISIIGTGLFSSIMGALWTVAFGKTAIGATIGGVLGLGLGAYAGFFNRRQQNENILDIMKRLPEGATKRDLLSDPVYQSGLNRAAMVRASRNNTMMTDALMLSMINSGNSRRR